jgi:hypothetical protein
MGLSCKSALPSSRRTLILRLQSILSVPSSSGPAPISSAKATRRQPLAGSSSVPRSCKPISPTSLERDGPIAVLRIVLVGLQVWRRQPTHISHVSLARNPRAQLSACSSRSRSTGLRLSLVHSLRANISSREATRPIS